MIIKYLKIRRMRKKQDNMFAALRSSNVELQTVVGSILVNYKHLNAINCTKLMSKLFIDYADNTKLMTDALAGSLPKEVEEKHYAAKIGDDRVLIELDFINRSLANCRISFVCMKPAEIEAIIAKKYESLGTEFSDVRVSHYTFARYDERNDLLLATYVNPRFPDTLNIHITDMRYSGL